jgi:hypothetical protein
MVHVQTDPGTRAWPLNTDSRSPFDSPGDACRLDCFEMCVQRSRYASMGCGSSAQLTHCLLLVCDQSREMNGVLVYWVLERVADVRGDGRRPIELGVRFGRFGGCGCCGSNGPSGWLEIGKRLDETEYPGPKVSLWLTCTLCGIR